MSTSEILIETDRTQLRKFKSSDYNDLYEYLSEATIYKYEPGKPITIEEARKLANQRSKGKDFIAVILKNEGKMIGHLYFKQIDPIDRRTWELGYIFNPKYYHMGYASEAAYAMVKYAFENTNAHRIMARCNPKNDASWKLLERIGCKREGHFKEYGFIHKDNNGNPIWTDAYEYSMLKEDFKIQGQKRIIKKRI
jgi:ribosomal-protein-alanine N-acetyltransferase